MASADELRIKVIGASGPRRLSVARHRSRHNGGRRPRGRPGRSPGASRTRKPGSSPAATGWAARSAVAEAVDRRDPGAADPGQQLAPPARSRASARRASSARIRWRISAAAFSVKVKARIASGETPLVADQAAVALDHHPGLAGAGAGLEQDVAAAVVDRRRLLGRRLRGGAGDSPPRSSLVLFLVLLVARGAVAAADRGEGAAGGADVVAAQARRGPGSRRMSPARMRATISPARRRESSSSSSSPSASTTSRR